MYFVPAHSASPTVTLPRRLYRHRAWRIRRVVKPRVQQVNHLEGAGKKLENANPIFTQPLAL